MTELITVKQLPIIVQKLETAAKEIEKKTQSALSLACTEETVKAVKTLRADLNKDSATLKEQYKAVETAVLAPWNEFKGIFNTIISDKYILADAQLKERISVVEDDLKDKKREKIKIYYNEYAESVAIDFVPFEKFNLNITLSATEKMLKEACKTFLDSIVSDMAMINTSEYKDEVIVEYRNSLNCSQSILTVDTRHKNLAQLQLQREMNEQSEKASQTAVKTVEAALTPPVVFTKETGETQFTLAFKVTATKPRLQELKQFLINGGYKYE